MTNLQRYPTLFPVALLAVSVAAAAAPARPFPDFVPVPLADSAEGMGRFREVLSPVDLDKDGDLDFFSGQGRGNKQYWFENRGSGAFAPHLVSDSVDTDVGAAIADIDNDGDLDRLAGGFLYRNPGNPLLAPFTLERTGAPEYIHDLLIGDFDGDSLPDFVIIDDGGIRWHHNPGKPSTPWPTTQVSGSDPLNQHGGIAVGDFDGDGDSDISRVDRWFENRNSGKVWVLRTGPDFGQWDQDLYGVSARTVVHDLDGDGDLDLAQAECDIRNGRIAWFENAGKGATWTRHLIKDSTDGQDYHSLGLADFDGDGDLDFFSAGAGLSREAERWYAWENLDGKAGSFREHVLWSGGRGGHENVAMDADGDGDADILGKEFNGYHTLLMNRRLGPAAVGPGRIHLEIVPLGTVDALGRFIVPHAMARTHRIPLGIRIPPAAEPMRLAKGSTKRPRQE